MFQQQQQQQMGYNVNQNVTSSGPQGYSSQQSGGMHSGGGVIPVTALTNLGVAAEAVGQISELKNYLSRQVSTLSNKSTATLDDTFLLEGVTLEGGESRLPPLPHRDTHHPPVFLTRYPPTLLSQFGLDLFVTQLGSGDYHHSSQVQGAPAPAIIPERRSSPDEVTFQIPRHSVGGIIGKGGQALKDLQTEFGVRVYVEREEVAGMRLVVLKPLSNTEPAGEVERAALQRCQERIMALSLQEQASEMKEA